MKDLDTCPHHHPDSTGGARCDRPADHRGLHGFNLTKTVRLTWKRSRDRDNYAPDPVVPAHWAWCCTTGEPCLDHFATALVDRMLAEAAS